MTYILDKKLKIKCQVPQIYSFIAEMHKIPTYTGPFRKAFSTLKHRWDAYRGSIKGTAQTSMFLYITDKTLTHLIVALSEPFRSKALNKGTRTWTN